MTPRYARIALRYVPRVIAALLALFALLLSYQLMWSALPQLTESLRTRQLWLLVENSSSNPGSGFEFSRTVDRPDLPVKLIAPLDARVELRQNGTVLPSESMAGGRRSYNVRLRPGTNYITATATQGEGERESQQFESLFVTYRSQAGEPTGILLSRHLPDGGGEFIGFGRPEGSVDLKVNNGIQFAQHTDASGVFRVLWSPSTPLESIVLSVPGAALQPGWLASSIELLPTPLNTKFKYANDKEALRRTIVFSVVEGALIIDASAHIPPMTALRTMFSLQSVTEGEFLRQVFGFCLMPEAGRMAENAGSLFCYQPPGPEDRYPEISESGDVALRVDVPIDRAMSVRFDGYSMLGGSFSRLPDDHLTVDYSKAGATRVQILGRDADTSRDSVAVWHGDADKQSTERLQEQLFAVQPATVVAASTVSATSQDAEPPAQRPRFLDRLRTLEAFGGQSVRQIFMTLLSGIPFLYMLWLLHAYPLPNRGHAATIKAVTLTYFIVHMSILAHSFFSASFVLERLQLIAAIDPMAGWAKPIQVLGRATYIYPFLSIGIVILVRPLFKVIRSAALAPRPGGRRFRRGLGWSVFWVVVIVVPSTIVWAFTVADLPSPDERPLFYQRFAIAMGVAFLCLWFVPYWLFRGVFRVPLRARHALLASTAMLVLPIVPRLTEASNAYARSMVASEMQVYPFFLPERINDLVAGAIVTLLGAFLLLHVGGLSVRMCNGRAVRWWREHRAALLLAALVISLPVTSVLNATDVTNPLYLLDQLLPYTVLIAILLLVRLHNPVDQFKLAPVLIHLGALAFAWYVAGGNQSVIFVPVPFIMAWLLFERWLIVPQSATVAPTRALLAAYLDERRAGSRYESLQKGLDKKFGDGNLTLSVYQLRLKEGQDALDQARATLAAATGGQPTGMFSRGAEIGPWANAMVAVNWGMVISAPFQVLTLVGMLKRGWGGGQFPLLEFTLALVYSVVTWGVMAAVFGYFFHVIRGRDGFQKALSFSLCAVLPAIPLRLVEETAMARGQIVDALQIVAFTLVLALVAFDLRTLRKHHFGWRDLMSTYGLASAAYGSTIALSVASALGGRDVLGLIWKYLTS